MTLRSEKVIFSLSKKLWTKKYPSSRFNHLSTTSASISPSNNGISKFHYTLKGVAWPPDEDASPVGNRRKIYAKLSIILFLCHVRASSSNILIRSLAPSSFLTHSTEGYMRCMLQRLACKNYICVTEFYKLPNQINVMWTLSRTYNKVCHSRIWKVVS